MAENPYQTPQPTFVGRGFPTSLLLAIVIAATLAAGMIGCALSMTSR